MKELWTETYRPNTLNDYVFKDQKQRDQIENWLKSGALPHILLTGCAGVGKCLHPSELLDFDFDLSKMSFGQIQNVMPYLLRGSKVTLNILALFNVFSADKIDYETEFLLPANSAFINSPSGYVPIRGLVRKSADAARYELEENGFSYHLQCGKNHLVFNENDECVPISTATTIKTSGGYATIIGQTDLGVIDLYDIALDSPHVYYSNNGVLHHNTSLAKMLFKELGVNPYDIFEINASKDNGVDFIRDSVVNFAQTTPFGEFKYVLLDEFDYATVNAQAVLRNVMEKYAATVRFVMTANYQNKIIPAIHSRCQALHIDKLDRDEFTVRVATILVTESVEFDIETLDSYVDSCYPDLRKCINCLQMNSYGGKLTRDLGGNIDTRDYQIEMVDLFKAGKYKEARQLICAKAGVDEYDDVYRFLYQNVNLFADTVDKEDKCIIAIRDGLAKHTLVSDIEINLSATITELSMIAKGIL